MKSLLTLIVVLGVMIFATTDTNAAPWEAFQVDSLEVTDVDPVPMNGPNPPPGNGFGGRD